jgi:hypothetical protein
MFLRNFVVFGDATHPLLFHHLRSSPSVGSAASNGDLDQICTPPKQLWCGCAVGGASTQYAVAELTSRRAGCARAIEPLHQSSYLTEQDHCHL